MSTDKVSISPAHVSGSADKVLMCSDVTWINVNGRLMSIAVGCVSIVPQASIVWGGHTSTQRKYPNYYRSNKNAFYIHDLSPD
ncbi:MAG: hypothetical protein K2P74_08610 [Nitrosomonas sp.]|nr:hypothetical protein [Nitrosomonas sp.]